MESRMARGRMETSRWGEHRWRGHPLALRFSFLRALVLSFRKSFFMSIAFAFSSGLGDHS